MTLSFGRFSGLLAAALLAACADGARSGGEGDGGPRRTECRTDRQCPEGRVCLDGQCVTSVGSGDAARPDCATAPCPVTDAGPARDAGRRDAARPAPDDDAGLWVEPDAETRPDAAGPGPDALVPPPPVDAEVVVPPPLVDAEVIVPPPPRDAEVVVPPPPRDAEVIVPPPPRDAALPPPLDAALPPPRDAAVPPPRDAAVPPPRDAAVPPPEDAWVTEPPDAEAPPDPDAAVIDLDAAPPEPDAAPPEPDAAPLPPDAFVPPPTPPRGVYDYRRLEIGGLAEARAVAFHPDGSYAVVLERTNVIHVVDWATGTARRFPLAPPNVTLYWEDLAFDQEGDLAVIVGWRLAGAARDGVLYHLDDDALRAGQPAPFAEIVRRAGEEMAAIAWPRDPAGRPVVLLRSNLVQSTHRIATLREYDPGAGRFDGLITATPSSAGCQDVAFANNELGRPGIMVVCGVNGAQVLYYTEIGGIGEWRSNPGNNNLGNVSRVASHRPGDYALFISWSGRRVMRFEAGLIGPTQSSPNYATRGIYGVAFQQEGQRALVFGQAGGNPLTGTVIEYRHPLYAIGDFTEVHIPNFGVAPYVADPSTSLNDAAFRPGCDGGLIVGGFTNWQGSRGHIIRFQIENGRRCP